MNDLNHYVQLDIFSFLDVDTKFAMCVVNKKICQLIGNIILEKETLNDARVSNNLHRFHLGLINNSFRIVRDEIKKGDYNNDLGGSCACHHGNIKMFQFFMDRNLDNYDDLITDACFSGHFEIVKLIIKKYPVYAQLGFSVATGTGHFDIADFLLQFCTPKFEEAIQWTCKYNGVDSVKYLIDKGFNNWNYGLEMSCYYDHCELIDLMIEKGADQCNHCGLTIDKHLVTTLDQRMRENETDAEYLDHIIMTWQQ